MGSWYGDFKESDNDCNNYNKILIVKIYMIKERHKSSPILPGERVASIEEFEGGKNTYVYDGLVRSKILGTRLYDFKRRIVKVDQKNSPTMTKVGDIVVGYVEALFGSMISIRILFINDKRSESGFSAIASTRLSGPGISSGWGRDRGERR